MRIVPDRRITDAPFIRHDEVEYKTDLFIAGFLSWPWTLDIQKILPLDK